MFYNDLDTLEQSFQDGCDIIVSGCTTYGSTPSSNSPTDIVNAIKNIYDNRYNAGRTQGQTDVKNNPGSYGLYTSSQYSSYGTSQYNAGRTQGQNDVKNNPGSYGLYTSSQYSSYGTSQYNAGRTQGQNDVKNNPTAYGITPAPKSQSGSETRNFKHGESYDWVVTFPTAFASTPKVNVGVQGLSFGYEVEANNLRITKAGFTYWVWNQAGQSQNIKLTWNAIL